MIVAIGERDNPSMRPVLFLALSEKDLEALQAMRTLTAGAIQEFNMSGIVVCFESTPEKFLEKMAQAGIAAELPPSLKGHLQ